MRLAIAVAVASVLLANLAIAQQNVVVINSGARVLPVSEKPQTVTVSFQLMLPAPVIVSTMDMTKAMAATTQSLYDIVNHECEVLTAALTGNCRLGKLTVGGNYNDPNFNVPYFAGRGNAAPLLNASATATFEIEPVPPAAAVAPAK